MADWIALLDKWQSLAAGLLGIVAAAVGGTFIFFQIAEGRRQDRDNRRRRHSAARAVMPLALSSMCDYATECGKRLLGIRRLAQDQRIPTSPNVPDFPSVPSDVVENFVTVIETSDEAIAEKFAEVLRDVQVQSSRLRSLPHEIAEAERVVVLSNIDAYIADAAELHAKCVALFDYARGRSDSVPVTPVTAEQAFTALAIMRIRDYQAVELYEHIARRAARRVSEADELRQRKRLGRRISAFISASSKSAATLWQGLTSKASAEARPSSDASE